MMYTINSLRSVLLCTRKVLFILSKVYQLGVIGEIIEGEGKNVNW